MRLGKINPFTGRYPHEDAKYEAAIRMRREAETDTSGWEKFVAETEASLKAEKQERIDWERQLAGLPHSRQIELITQRNQRAADNPQRRPPYFQIAVDEIRARERAAERSEREAEERKAGSSRNRAQPDGNPRISRADWYPIGTPRPST